MAEKKKDLTTVEEWRNSALKDLEAARYNFEGELFSYSAFLCQQAAEKALKAVHIDRFDENLATHNLVRLAKEVGATEEVIDICSELDQLYVETRYPDSLEEFSKEDVQEFLEKAEEVVEWTSNQ